MPPRYLQSTRQKIIFAQEPVSVESQDKADFKAAMTLIKRGGDDDCPSLADRGWEILVRIYLRRFRARELSLDDAALLAGTRAEFEKQIEEYRRKDERL